MRQVADKVGFDMSCRRLYQWKCGEYHVLGGWSVTIRGRINVSRNSITYSNCGERSEVVRTLTFPSYLGFLVKKRIEAHAD